MTSTISRLVLHGTSLAIMIYGYSSLSTLMMHAFLKDQVGGHAQFLTIQGLLLAAATMACGLVLDVFPSLDGLRTIKRLLLMMSLPLTFVISSIYWTLILMFPRLIMWVGPPEGSSIPTEIPEMWRIPLSMDLSLHAVPLIAVALDFLVFERKYTERQQRVHAPILTALYAVWYGAWVEWCASYNGTFPYPFLTESPFKIRLVIYAVVTVIAVLAFWGLNKAHPQKTHTVRGASSRTH